MGSQIKEDVMDIISKAEKINKLVDVLQSQHQKLVNSGKLTKEEIRASKDSIDLMKVSMTREWLYGFTV